jgi:DNA end-binding protein Ku
VAVQAYALLAAALKETGRVGIGKVVLHDREDTVLIAPDEQALILYKLRSPRELRDIRQIPQLDGKALNVEELKLARSLVESMSTTLDRLDLTDRYHEALRALIEAKISGREVVTMAAEEKPVVDIMTALKQSIAQAKLHKKPMAKATGAKKQEVFREVRSGSGSGSRS